MPHTIPSNVMPLPGNTAPVPREFMPTQSMPWLNEALGGGLLLGGQYLLSGEPGIGKSTLAVQILADLAMQGIDVLYITTEEPIDRIEANLLRLSAKGGRLPKPIKSRFNMEKCECIEDLPAWLRDRLLPGCQYEGVRAIVLDSIQGEGLSSNSTKAYEALYSVFRIAKLFMTAMLSLAHVTKSGQIGGPETLQHNVDAILHLKRAFLLRPLFIPKNRFAPAILDPIPLILDAKGRLTRSPQAIAKPSTVLGFSGKSQALAEAQAFVELPKYSTKSNLNPTGLPQAKMRQLVKILGKLREVDLSELTYDVQIYIPGRTRYAEELDLALAVSLLGSYFHLYSARNRMRLSRI